MKQAFNFNAGPCVLPKQAIESTVKALYDFDNTGIGIAEISHRTPGWERIMAETRQLWRDLLNIPEEYEVLFLGGGASTQFFTVPANLMKTKAAYLQTGVWAKKAAKEAKEDLHLHPEGLQDPAGCRLLPHHDQQHHLRY